MRFHLSLGKLHRSGIKTSERPRPPKEGRKEGRKEGTRNDIMGGAGLQRQRLAEDDGHGTQLEKGRTDGRTRTDGGRTAAKTKERNAQSRPRPPAPARPPAPGQMRVPEHGYCNIFKPAELQPPYVCAWLQSDIMIAHTRNSPIANRPCVGDAAKCGRGILGAYISLAWWVTG